MLRKGGGVALYSSANVAESMETCHTRGVSNSPGKLDRLARTLDKLCDVVIIFAPGIGGVFAESVGSNIEVDTTLSLRVLVLELDFCVCMYLGMYFSCSTLLTT